jgi:hypothetical protein
MDEGVDEGIFLIKAEGRVQGVEGREKGCPFLSVLYALPPAPYTLFVDYIISIAVARETPPPPQSVANPSFFPLFFSA